MNMYNPPHPGEFIKETYLEPLRVSIRTAALKLNVAPSTFARLIKGDADISPVMALKLSKAFGRSAESWMSMQAEYKLWEARHSVNLDNVSSIYPEERR